MADRGELCLQQHLAEGPCDGMGKAGTSKAPAAVRPESETATICASACLTGVHEAALAVTYSANAPEPAHVTCCPTCMHWNLHSSNVICKAHSCLRNLRGESSIFINAYSSIEPVMRHINVSGKLVTRGMSKPALFSDGADKAIPLNSHQALTCRSLTSGLTAATIPVPSAPRRY